MCACLQACVSLRVEVPGARSRVLGCLRPVGELEVLPPGGAHHPWAVLAPLTCLCPDLSPFSAHVPSSPVRSLRPHPGVFPLECPRTPDLDAVLGGCLSCGHQWCWLPESRCERYSRGSASDSSPPRGWMGPGLWALVSSSCSLFREGCGAYTLVRRGPGMSVSEQGVSAPSQGRAAVGTSL